MPSLTDNLFDAAFGDAKAASTFPGFRGGADVVFGRGASPAGGRFSASSARKQLEAYAGKGGLPIDWVMAALNLITDTATTAEWYVEQDDGKRLPSYRKDAEKGARLAPDDLVSLLERPNPWMDYGELIKLTLIDEILTGDAFWLLYGKDIDGKPLSIYRLSPAMVEVIPSEDNFIGAYRYSVPGMTPVDFAPEDILHFRNPNPHDPYRGAGVIAGAPRTFDMELALTDTKASYFENGTRLSGVLETDRSMNDGLVTKVKRQFLGQYAGSGSAYTVAVLERGLKFNPISSTAEDAQFGQLSDQSRDRILALLRVPTSLLGLSAGEGGVAGAMEDDRRTFDNYTMRPLLDKLELAISQGLTEPGWGLKFCIEYEYQMPVQEQLKLSTEKAALPGITIREVRESANLPRLTEVLEDEAEAKKIEQVVLNLPGSDENNSEVKDRNLGSEPGRPPKGENTKPVTAADLPADAKARSAA